MNFTVALEQAGKEPSLIGLATIGGVLALLLLGLRVLLLVYGARRYFTGSIVKFRRALLLHDYRQLRLARLVKRAKLSDLFLIRPALVTIADKVSGLLIDVLMIMLGLFLYKSQVSFGPGVIGGGVLAATLDGYLLVRALRRISWLLEAGNFPKKVLSDLSVRRRKLKL